MAASMKPREFDFPDAKVKLSEEYACLNVIDRELPIGMPPKYLRKENEFIKLVLKNKLGRYEESLQCIPVSVQKIRRLGSNGIISNEDSNIYFKVLVDFIVFQPVVASKVSARVEKLSASHIGLLVHGWFNASVPRDKNDKAQAEVGVGDTVLLEVVRSNVNRRMLSLECKLLKIIEKGEVVMDTSMVASGNHKLLDSDDELAKESTVQVTKKGKKRSRTETLGSDSGIDHDKLENSFTATQENSSTLQQPSKKKRKSEQDDTDGAVKDDQLAASGNRIAVNKTQSNSPKKPSPKKSSPKKSPKRSSIVKPLSPTKDYMKKALVFSEQDESTTAVETDNVLDTSVELSGKGKKKKKKRRDAEETMTASQETVESIVEFVTPGKKLKKEKKKQDENEDIATNGITHNSQDTSTSVEEEFATPSSKKSKKKKKDKMQSSDIDCITLDSSALDDSIIADGDNSMAKKKKKKKHKDAEHN